MPSLFYRTVSNVHDLEIEDDSSSVTSVGTGTQMTQGCMDEEDHNPNPTVAARYICIPHYTSGSLYE